MASYARHARIAYNPRPKPKAEKTMRSLSQIAARLDAGEPSRALIDQCIERIKDPAGEGDRVFLKVYGEAARTAADAFDQLRRRDATPSRCARRRPRPAMPPRSPACARPASCRSAAPT